MSYNRPNKSHYVTYEAFMDLVAVQLKDMEQGGDPMSLLAVDFNNFKYVNDLYGYEIGDQVLDEITRHMDGLLGEGDILSRPHSDYFFFCLQSSDAAVVKAQFHALTDAKAVLDQLLPQYHMLVASGGIYVPVDGKLPVSTLLDRANHARKTVKGNVVSSVAVYDEKMEEEAKWRKLITCMMDEALENQEFELYLQPKIILKTKQVMGAEALVRWNSRAHGMIYPGSFISIFEKNGFIQKLDFYMLEQACDFLVQCRSQGLPMLPISINFSKVHLHNDRLVEQILESVKRHQLETHLIEVEFTESVMSETIEELLKIVSDLKRLGFGVSIDDFGNEYSSLSYLKSLPVDVIKIDKSFLDFDGNIDRSKITLTKIVELIKSLHMLPVMEGVETDAQVEFLQMLRCNIVQGYLYAKPMPKEQYQQFIQSNPLLGNMTNYIQENACLPLDEADFNARPDEFSLDSWELYTLSKNIDLGLMKGYLDGEATVQYVNDRALEYLGYSRQEFREMVPNSILSFTHPDDAEIVQQNTRQLMETGNPLEFESRAIHKDGRVVLLKGRASRVIDEAGRPIGLYAFQDVTEEQARTQALQSEMEDKIAQLENIVSLEQEAKEAFVQNRFLLEHLQGGIVYSDFDPPFRVRYATEGMAELSGYTPAELINLEQMDLVWPEDIEFLAKDVGRQLAEGDTFAVEYRLLRKDGTYCHILDRAKVVAHEDGQKYIHCILTDVTQLKEMELLARINQEKYKFVIQQSGNVMMEYNLETQMLSFSDNYAQLFGCEAPIGTLQELVRSHCVDDSHQEQLLALFDSTIQNATTSSMELLIYEQGQSRIWCSLDLVPIIDDGCVHYVIGCLKSIDDQKNQVEQLTKLSMRDGLTGIYNRYAIEKFVKEQMANRIAGKAAALLILDIDNFKSINDNFGHDYGDEVIIHLVEVIAALLPADAVFGRLGGDEFLVLATFDAQSTALQELAQMLVEQVALALKPVTISVGGAWQSEACCTFKDLYKHADMALYQTKNKNKSGYTIYAMTPHGN